MKRAGHLFEQIADFENLLVAFQKARLGKGGRPAVERFTRLLEPELFRLQEELKAGSYAPGQMITFEVFDPKKRLISVAPFRDRVVHHAIIRIIQSHLERGFDADSYGCRVGKGTDGALARAVQLLRRHRACLTTDVRNFFASVSHDLVIGQLARIFKDARLLRLLEMIVRTGGAAGRGLPIGSLTSQWLANLYLTPLDRFVRNHSAAGGYCRYMDDCRVFGQDASSLRGLAVEVQGFLQRELQLELRGSATQVYTRSSGVPFLGFRVTSGGLEVRRQSWRRFVLKLRRREWEYREGRIDLDALARSTASMMTNLDRARSLPLRRRFLADHAPVEW